jgi:hypothetical protein
MMSMSSVTPVTTCGGILRSWSLNGMSGTSEITWAPFWRASSRVARSRRYDFSSITEV